MTTTTKLLLALSALGVGAVVWAIRKKAKAAPFGRTALYADAKDPESNIIADEDAPLWTGKPYEKGRAQRKGKIVPKTALSRWRCTSAEIPGSVVPRVTRLILAHDTAKAGPSFACSADVCEALRPMRSLNREEMYVIALNTRNQMLGSALVSAGSVRQTLVDPPEVFKPALLMNATRVLVAHNHPSGDPTPSPDDVALTRRLVEAGERLGIPVLDHVILGAGDQGACRSLRDMGLVDFR